MLLVWLSKEKDLSNLKTTEGLKREEKGRKWTQRPEKDSKKS